MEEGKLLISLDLFVLNLTKKKPPPNAQIIICTPQTKIKKKKIVKHTHKKSFQIIYDFTHPVQNRFQNQMKTQHYNVRLPILHTMHEMVYE